MSPIRLDVRRLKKDVALTPRPSGVLAPGGRPATGLMEAVRDNFDAILALKATGASWGAIASGLSAQGYTTADGRPVDAKNLTGVISSLRRQTARRATKAEARMSRSDLPRPATRPSRRLSLASELAAPRSAPSSVAASATEEAIRSAALEKLQGLLKPDPTTKD